MEANKVHTQSVAFAIPMTFSIRYQNKKTCIVPLLSKLDIQLYIQLFRYLFYIKSYQSVLMLLFSL